MSKTNKNSKNNIFEERKHAYMLDFAKEASYIRDSLVKDLPAYNKLLSLEAQSFEEFALQHYANEHGIPYDKDHPPVPDCPYCHTNEKVGTKGDSLYRCNSCGHSFVANHNSISSGAKHDALTWMKVLTCILEYKGMTKTCEYCGITNTTYYKIRNRLFYAMQVLMDEVKLYGNIQADNTFVRISYKGADLQESEFDEDSIFFDPSFKARDPRHRGGAYGYRERNANSICIFTAIDDYGHVVTRFTGVGATNYQALLHYIPDNKYLLSVPKKDPFRALCKKQHRDPMTKPGDKSLMIADKEKAVEKYALRIGLQFESHVFRRNGVQVRLSNDSHNIQRVNALHRRLKDFLRNHHYVSTKYLPGYLILFEFIENTGASDEAIGKLFQILAKPNFDKPSKFFDEMYSVPNYLQEWLIGDNPLSKQPYNKLLAFYLYDHIKHKEEYPESVLTIKDIEDETGYTAPTFRKHYRDFVAAGYRDLILDHFNKRFFYKKDKQNRQKKNLNKAPTTVNPTVIAIYDEYAQNRLLPPRQRLTFKEFLDIKNEQYGTNYKQANMHAKFSYIEKNGIRPPMGKLPSVEKVYGNTNLPPMAVLLADEYDKIVLSYRERGEQIPSRGCICKVLSDKHNLSPVTVSNYVAIGKRYKKEQKNKSKNED